MTFVWQNGNLPVGQGSAVLIPINYPNLQSFAVRNVGSTTQILSWIDREGTSQTKTFTPLETWLLRDQNLNQVWVDGGSVYAFIQDEPGWADPKAFFSDVGAASKVDVIQQEAGLALDNSLQTILTKVTSIDNKLTTTSTSHGTVLAVHDQGA